MHTERGFTRLVGFSDGVVAIAITLLVLPLVTSASEISTDLGAYLAANDFQLFIFAVSFAVIGRFWLVHHQLYENLVDYNGALLWANLLWLATIVFLPFPSELLVAGDRENQSSPGIYALYIGTMVATSAAALLQQWVAVRHPSIQAEEVRGQLRLRSFVLVTSVLIVALVIAVTVPQIGLWSLALLAVSATVDGQLTRRKKRRAAKASG